MGKRYTIIFSALLIAVIFGMKPQPAFAIELDAAKQQGLVGETAAGYLAAVSPPSAEVQQLVNRINSERKERYQAIAEKNHTPVGAVEALAGKKATDMTPTGQYVQEASGKWVKK